MHAPALLAYAQDTQSTIAHESCGMIIPTPVLYAVSQDRVIIPIEGLLLDGITPSRWYHMACLPIKLEVTKRWCPPGYTANFPKTDCLARVIISWVLILQCA